MLHTITAFTILGILVLLVVPWGFLLFLAGFLFPRPIKQITYRTAQGWARIIILVTGCRVTVRGREHIPKKGPVCFASNHSGIFDIILFLAYAGRPAGFIAKIELAWVPAINFWILLLGGLFINRTDMRKSLKTIHRGGEVIKQGGAMIIFPEGTRSKGRGLLPFKAGSFRLATDAGSPVVPVAISGSYEMFEQQRRIRKTDVTITFCPVIDTASLAQEDRRQVLAARVEAAVAGALADAGT